MTVPRTVAYCGGGMIENAAGNERTTDVGTARRRPVVVEDVVARRARCVWARCATHREDDDDGDDDDARAMRVFHDDDDDGSTIERGQGTRTTTT